MKRYVLINCLFCLFLMLCSELAQANKASDYIKTMVDSTVRPEDDLYGYVNGTWAKGLSALKKSTCTVTVEDAQREIAAQCIAGKGELRNNKVNLLYNSLIDAKMDDLRSAVESEMNTVVNINDKKDIPNLIFSLNKIGVKNILGINVVLNSNANRPNDSKWNVDIKAFKTNCNTEDKKSDSSNVAPSAKAIQDDFRQLLNRDISGDMAGKILNISKIVASFACVYKDSAQISLLDLKQEMHVWDKRYWNENFLDLPQFKKDNVSIHAMKYIDNYLNLLDENVFNKYDLESLKTYFKYLILLRYKQVLSISSISLSNKDRFVKDLVVDVVGSDLTSACFKDYVDSRKTKITGMFENIITAYKDAVRHTEYWSDKTKSVANAKLQNLTHNLEIGYSPFYNDYSEVVITNKDPIGNLHRIYESQYEHMVKNIGSNLDFDPSAWDINKGTNYNILTNKIYLHIGAITPPNFYDSDDFTAFNYGSFGTVLAHEISH